MTVGPTLRFLLELHRRTLNSVVFGISLMVLTASYIAIGSGIPAVREYFEMNELQFFSAFPLKLLMFLLVLNLATVTWLRIPLTPPRYGVWMIHSGIILLIAGMAFYYQRKVEGMTRLFVDAREGPTSTQHFYDHAERALYVRVNDTRWSMTPLPDLPRFREYEQLKLPDIVPTAQVPGDNGELVPMTLSRMFGLKDEIKLDVTGYWPYATITNTFREQPGAGAPGLKLSIPEMPGMESLGWLLADDPRSSSMLLASTELEYRTGSADAGNLFLVTPRINGQTLPEIAVEPGKTYSAGAYTLIVERYEPSWPMVTGEVVRALTLKVKGPSGEFRRMILEGKELQTDFKPSGERQKEPIDKDLVLLFRVNDPKGLLPTRGQVRHNLFGTDKELMCITTSRDGAVQVRESVGEVELSSESPATTQPSHPAVKLKLERRENVVREERVQVVPSAQRDRNSGEAGVFQVLRVRVRMGEWSKQVLVPFAQDAADVRWDAEAIPVADTKVRLQLQLGDTQRPLPARLTLKRFEVIPYPGVEPGMGGMIREFRSTLEVQDLRTGERFTDAAHLNHPIYFDGGRWLFFQAAYDGQNQRWTALGVGNRPGVWIMTGGCVPMTIGLLYAFYLKPLIIRRMKDKALAKVHAMTRAMVLLLMLVGVSARAAEVDVAPLQTLSVQHRQTIKTLDSYARQVLDDVTGRGSLDGKPALWTVLDMSFRPENYLGRNLIKIRNVPLRKDFQQLDYLSLEERQRIVKEGTVSLEMFLDPRVQSLLDQLEAQAVFKANAVNQVRSAASVMASVLRKEPDLPNVAMIAPAEGERWHTLNEIVPNAPTVAKIVQQGGNKLPPPLPGYDNAKLDEVIQSWAAVLQAWRGDDAGTVNANFTKLSQLLPTVAPARYPSEIKRKAEVFYNRLAKLTLPASALYFIAFVCLLMSARSSVSSLRKWGLALFAVALAVHTAGIAIRWWLVAGQHGSWFDGIPIKNQFESVMMSAWFGAVVGFALETGVVQSIIKGVTGMKVVAGKGQGMIGAAASFVGWLSLTAIFATPYVTGREIGGEIGQVQGVLMSYWLYIHVTMVTASYALIGMAFLLSVWWLVRYHGSQEKVGGAHPTDALLARLDACNVVVLQLAFWVLGAGIILGAVWADQSWGRPWGWDPKETFALVTWIVYLVVVHVRVAAVDKAWWTATLSIVGFFIMLFNWIGVNFFLVGLHSYA